MARSFAASIDIQAPADKVWRILIDLPRWPQWNTTVERTIGNVECGSKVTVFVRKSPGRAFPLRATELDAPRRMVWTGGLAIAIPHGPGVPYNYNNNVAPTVGARFTF